MAILPNQRIFAYNTGLPISGTTEYGDLIVGDINVDYSLDYGGVKWWGGPDENFRWVIGNARPGGQPTPSGVVGTAQVGFWGSNPIGVKTDETFLNLANYIGSKNAQPPFATVNDATTWLNANGYYTSYNNVTPTPTGTLSVTPTPTSTPTMYYYSVSGYSCGVSCTLVGSYTVMSPTPLTIGYFYNNPENRGYTFEILSLIPAVGGAYDLTGEPGYADCVTACVGVTPTPTVTQTPTLTPTVTPTPSVTPQPVTGYSFNLVALPYNFPSSGNTIMNGAGGATSGTTDPNVLATGSRGIYWNSIDSDGIDRTDYFSGFTGQSITITMSQTGSTAIYSGDTNSLKTWTSAPDNGFVFGAGIGVPPVGTPSGTAVLIQSASTQWTLGLPVYISVVINGGVTPTPTATNTATPTPSISPNPTSTPTNTPTPTETPSSGSVVNMTLLEVGGDVVLSGAGTMDLTSLNFLQNKFSSANLVPVGSQFGCGTAGPGPFNSVFYTGATFSSPANFGTGGQTVGNSGTGDFFGIGFLGVRGLFVQSGYTSGSFISGTTTFNSTTLATLGATPGTYTWSWGAGATASSIVMQVGT